MAHKQKKDPFAPIALLIGLAILGVTVFVLVSSLLNTISNNSIKGAEDNSRQVAMANENLKPVGSVTTTADVPKGATAAPVVTGNADGEAIYKATCFTCHATGVAASPILGNKEHWEPRVANGLSALMTTAMNGKGAMPAKGGNPALSEAEVKAAVLYMTKQAGFDLGGGDTSAKKEAPAAETAPEKAEPAKKEAAPTKAEPTKEEAAPTKPEPVAEPTKPETPATPATPVTPVVPAAPAAPTPKEAEPAKTEAPAEKPAETASSADGEAIYNATCFACHKTGVAGAPLLGDKVLWAPRIATGMEALITSVLKGKGAMPPKGGNTALSDDEVKAAIVYMVEQAQ